MTRPAEIRLDEALEQIVEYAAGVCEAATEPGGLLAELTGVVTGDRARARPEPPYLWVVIAGATATHATAQHEKWAASLMLSTFVQSEDPEDGWLEAMAHAARARSVVLADRTLGDDLGYVEDTQSSSLEPIGQLRSGRRFGAFARLDVHFAIVEPQP